MLGLTRKAAVVKDKDYFDTRYSADVLYEALASFRDRASQANSKPSNLMLKVEHDDSTWTHDTIDEFMADYRKCQGYAVFSVYGDGFDLSVTCLSRKTAVSVKAPTRLDIEVVFGVFEKYATQSRLPSLPPEPMSGPVVFIGHGRSGAWRDLKDHLQDKHGIAVEAYETGARAGHSIRDVLEDMAEKSTFAVLIMTAEDEQKGGGIRARQNVIHEAGLFQGRLGFPRAILLLEQGVEEFSNVQGVQYVSFSKNNIKETFGEVLATLRREFGR